MRAPELRVISYDLFRQTVEQTWWALLTSWPFLLGTPHPQNRQWWRWGQWWLLGCLLGVNENRKNENGKKTTPKIQLCLLAATTFFILSRFLQGYRVIIHERLILRIHIYSEIRPKKIKRKRMNTKETIIFTKFIQLLLHRYTLVVTHTFLPPPMSFWALEQAKRLRQHKTGQHIPWPLGSKIGGKNSKFMSTTTTKKKKLK